MILSRRAFLRTLGLALGSLALARCGPRPDGNTPRDRLRRAWLDLDTLAKTTGQDSQRGETMMNQLSSDHRAAVDELVAAGELTAAVGGNVQAAFDAAASHLWRSNAPITCYEPATVNYTPVSANDLAQRADLLAEMAVQGKLDADTVARARASVERDIAFLALSDADEKALYDRLIQAQQAGNPLPPFDQLDLSIPPDAAEAARFLVEVLAQGKE
jgi:hypothetical protein